MTDTIHVRVLCFSHVRAVLGRAELDLELPRGATVEQVTERLVAMGEGKLDGLPMKIAVNRSFAEAGAPIADGDEIALIPPVQGGAPSPPEEPPRVHVEVTPQPLPPFEPRAPREDAGAEIVFHGRVRGLEAERHVVALHYEQYEGMARAELERLARACADRFDLIDLSCVHRVGEVPVGQASMRVVIRSRHRREGIDGLDWFIRELKVRVPIWKWGVTRDGERFPSAGGIY